jgi:hypothetical protein
MRDDYTDEPLADIVPDGLSSQLTSDPPAANEIGPTFDLSIFVEPQGIVFQFHCEGHKREWTAPKTVVRRAHKAMTIDHVFDLLGAGPILGYQLCEAVTNEPEFLMVPRAVNSLTDQVTKALRRVQKEKAEKAAVAEKPSP